MGMGVTRISVVSPGRVTVLFVREERLFSSIGMKERPHLGLR